MRFALIVLALASFTHCSSRTPTSVGPRQTPAPPGSPPPATATPTPAAPAAPAEAASPTPSGPTFSTPTRFGRLAVYTVNLPNAAQEDPGPLLLLDDALRQGLAEVRELGAAPAAPTANAPVAAEDLVEGPVEQIQQRGDGAAVGTLVIENKSDTPIFVLAGTVVKGGKQDRQIGQDFVVDARQTTPVDAFCVEQGRWHAQREGAATEGKFAAVPALATSKVRAAGQYRKDQQAVWHNVAETNKAHAKATDSGTLLATLDDPEVAARIDALSRQVSEHLAASTPRDALVGLAWAIDDQIQGVRWFAHRRVFDLVADKLVRAAAVDALTAEAAGPAPALAVPPPPDAVARFVAEVERAAAEVRATPAKNDNEYRESKRAWGSATVLKGKDGKRARPLAYDFIAK